ncbi:MAG: hypothetical protein Q7T03_05335 [Deltaproteobacteria bacterium]|nr:hypothetical protein [Deltaproteobacteria bacterium]
MRHSHLTRQERHVILWLRLLMVAFAMVGMVFLFAPNYFLHYLDGIGAVFFNFTNAPLESPRHEIWWVLTLAVMGAMTYVCFQAQLNWIRNHNMVPVVIIAKGISALGLLLLLFFYLTHFFYIVAFLVDGLLCLITWYAYAQAIKSRTF